MVHLLANSESLTVVVDDGSQGEMKALLEAIGASLKMDLFLMARSAA